MARPRTITDDEILSAVRRCVFKHGPGVSTSCIAASIGISQATLFKRFDDKVNLLLCALAPQSPPLFLSLIQECPSDPGVFKEVMVRVGVAAMAHFRIVLPRIMAIRQAGIASDRLMQHFDVPPPVLVKQGLTDWFQRAIDAGTIHCIDASTFAFGFIGGLQVRVFFDVMLQPTSEVNVDAIEVDDRKHVVQLVDSLWHGIEPGGRV